jgi:hypothetical protein
MRRVGGVAQWVQARPRPTISDPRGSSNSGAFRARSGRSRRRPAVAWRSLGGGSASSRRRFEPVQILGVQSLGPEGILCVELLAGRRRALAQGNEDQR